MTMKMAPKTPSEWLTHLQQAEVEAGKAWQVGSWEEEQRTLRIAIAKEELRELMAKPDKSLRKLEKALYAARAAIERFYTQFPTLRPNETPITAP